MLWGFWCLVRSIFFFVLGRIKSFDLGCFCFSLETGEKSVRVESSDFFGVYLVVLIKLVLNLSVCWLVVILVVGFSLFEK